MQGELLILTFSNTTKHPGYFNFINSMNKYGYIYKIIGENIQWKNFVDTKIKNCLNYITRLKNKPKLIAIVDCFDVLACGPYNETLTKFYNTKYPILISVEKMCGSNCRPLQNYHFNNQSNKNFVNGGFYMGYTNEIIHLLSWIVDTLNIDDQVALSEYVDTFPEKCYLDNTNSIIANITGKDFRNFEYKNVRIIDIKTKEFPCFVHIPGGKIDFNLRMDYFGKKILGSQYQSIPLSNHIKRISKTYYAFIFVFMIILAMFLLYKVPKIAISLFIIVGIMISYYCRII